LVLRTGLQGHGSQQECCCGQDHRGLSHQSLLFQGCRIEGNARQRPDRYTPSGASFYDIASSNALRQGHLAAALQGLVQTSRRPDATAPLPAAVVCRGIGRLLCGARSQTSAAVSCAQSRPVGANPALCLQFKKSRLRPAATSPAAAAATATTTAATASPAASASAEAASAAATSASAAPSNLFKSSQRCRSVFLVEDVERRQTDVGNFFLTEEEFVMRCGVLHRHIHRRPSS
jgi:hypothetical protein